MQPDYFARLSLYVTVVRARVCACMCGCERALALSRYIHTWLDVDENESISSCVCLINHLCNLQFHNNGYCGASVCGVIVLKGSGSESGSVCLSVERGGGGGGREREREVDS